MTLDQAIMDYVHVIVRSSHQEILLPEEQKDLVRVEENLKKACSKLALKTHTLRGLFSEEDD